MSSNNMNYYKFSFISNMNWIYNYLLNFKGKNKSLEDVKEDSINTLEEIFRQKGYGEHSREKWIKCAQEEKCSNECRDSNGFKNRYDIQYKRKKCVPYTRKINPKYKPSNINSWLNKSNDPNDKDYRIYQYAYDFLTSYNSIVYTLQNWQQLQRNSSKVFNQNKLNDNDKIIQYIVNSYSSNIIEKILDGILQYRNENYISLVKKMKSTGLINHNRLVNYPNSNYNPYPRYDPYSKSKNQLSEFDKRSKQISEEYTNNTLPTSPTLTGGTKTNKTKKTNKAKKTNEEDVCPICLDEINTKIPKLLCKHKFHKECLSSVCSQHNNINVRCPLCRAFISFECITDISKNVQWRYNPYSNTNPFTEEQLYLMTHEEREQIENTIKRLKDNYIARKRQIMRTGTSQQKKEIKTMETRYKTERDEHLQRQRQNINTYDYDMATSPRVITPDRRFTLDDLRTSPGEITESRVITPDRRLTIDDLIGGKKKSRKSSKNKKQHKTKKYNKSNKQKKTQKYRKSKK